MNRWRIRKVRPDSSSVKPGAKCSLPVARVRSPYANVLAVQAARSQDPRIQALAKALTSPEVARFIRERYQGAVVPSGGAAE